MRSIREQTISGVKWNTIGSLSSKGVHFVLGLMIARILVPDDYGVIGMLAIFLSVSQAFIDSGFSNALQMPILTDILRVLAITIVVNSLGIVPRALRSIAVDFKSQACASVIAAVVSGIIGLILAYNGYGVWALVWQSLMSVLIEVVAIWLLAGWRPKMLFSISSFRIMFSYGSKLLFSGLLHKLYANLSGLLIGKYYTSSDLGFYNRGHQIATMPSMGITSTGCHLFTCRLIFLAFPIIRVRCSTLAILNN